MKNAGAGAAALFLGSAWLLTSGQREVGIVFLVLGVICLALHKLLDD